MANKSSAAAHKKNSMTPSIRKVLLMLVLLLVPIILAGAGFLLYSVFTAQQDAQDRISIGINSQLAELDTTLSTVNLYLSETVMNSPLIKKISTEIDDHEMNVAARSLGDEFERQNSFWSGNFNFMFHRPMQNLSLVRYDPRANYDDNVAIRNVIEQRIASGNSGANRLLWSHMVINDRVYLMQLYTYKGNYISCWISCDSIFKFISDAVLTESGFYSVLTSDNIPVLGPETLKAHGITIENNKPVSKHPENFCDVYTMRRVNIHLLVGDNPYINQENLFFVLAFLCVTLAIVFAFSVYSLFYFHKYIESPFKQFQNHINDYVSVRENVKRRGFSEVNQAVEAFDSLSKQLSDLKIDVYEEKLALAKTELEYFQLQIKPHFFVNCFSIIFGMAQKKDFARIQDFCIKLSNYVRFLFRDSFSTVPISEELSILHEYLDIQNIRHRTESEVRDCVDEALLSCQIPPLLLLTFVENSVKHAGSGTESLVIIVKISPVSSQDETRRLRLVVEDNGAGFSEEQLSELNSTCTLAEKCVPDGSSVGTRNIAKRLFLIYGSRFSLHFSNTDHGACVEIILPDIPPFEQS